MKRSSSTIDDDEIPSSPAPSQSGSEEFKPDITPSPTSKTKKTKAVPKTPTPRKRVKKESSDDSGNGGGSGGSGGNGEWTPEKKGIFMDRVIAAGYKVLGLGELAEELGMAKNQLKNQLAPGRKGSFREKAVQAIVN